MIHTIDPGRTRPSIFMFDHIPYSHVTDLDGNPLTLELSILSQMEGSELQVALGRKQPEERPDAVKGAGTCAVHQRPVIVWFNGNGFRAVDKHCQIGDLAFLAEHGYAVCFVEFRNSAQGKLPAPLIDAKTAIRFLRANAARYSLDPNRIGVAGRSAGGMIVSMLGLNDGRFLSEEWKDYSSDVQAVWDLFGLTDLALHSKKEIDSYRNGTADTSRWKRAEDTHIGAVLGGDAWLPCRSAHRNLPHRLLFTMGCRRSSSCTAMLTLQFPMQTALHSMMPLPPNRAMMWNCIWSTVPDMAHRSFSSLPSRKSRLISLRALWAE